MAAVTKAQKQTEIELIRAAFGRAVSAVMLDPRGISVPMTTELRSRFRQAGIDYRVIKNNLVSKALEGSPLASNAAFKNLLVGMTGIAWSYEDPSAAAKLVKAFRKENEEQGKLHIKGAVIETQVFGAEQVETQVATLPGKNEMRATLLAQLLAPAQSLVRQLGAAGQNFAYLLDARKRQLEAQQ